MDASIGPQENPTAPKAASKQAIGFAHGRPKCATYPQSPFSGSSRCCDVTDPSRAFSQHAGPGRLWISLDAVDHSPLNHKPNNPSEKARRIHLRLSSKRGSGHYAINASVGILIIGLHSQCVLQYCLYSSDVHVPDF